MYLRILLVFAVLESSLLATSLGQIRDAWALTQEAAASATFVIKGKQTLAVTPKLSIQGDLGVEGRSSPETVTTLFESEIAFLGDKASRVDARRPQLHLESGELLDVRRTSAFDGETFSATLVHQPGVVNTFGTIKPPSRGNIDSTLPEYLPVFMTYRPFTIFRDLDRMKVVGEKDHEGEKLFVLSGDAHECWLDPSMNFVVRHYFLKDQGGTTRVQVDVNYELVDDVPVPTTWRTATLGSDGKLNGIFAVDVTRHAINPGLDKSVFRLEFPPGSVVEDRRDRRHTRRLLVKPDGKHRELSRDAWMRIMHDGTHVISNPGY